MKTFNRILAFALAAAPLLATAQWSAVRFDNANVFHRVHAVTPDDAYLIGNEPMAYAAFLLRTHDAGLTWDSIPFNTASDAYQLSELQFVNLTTGFAGGLKNNTHQSLLKSSDDGNTWTDVTPEPLSLEAIGALHFINTTHGFASAGDRFFATTDGGATWTASTADFIASDLKFINTTLGYAAGRSASSNLGVVLKTTDGGASWQTLLEAADPNAFVNELNMLNAVNANTLFVQHDFTNAMYRTLNGGATWDTVRCDSVWQIIDFHFNDVNNGFLLSGYGQLFSTTDGGVSWTLDYSAEWGFYGPSVMFQSLSFAGGAGYVCGTSGLIKRFEKNSTGLVERDTRHATLTVFPNPAHGANGFTLDATGLRGDCRLTVVNGVGQVVLEKEIRNVHHQPVFNVPGLPLLIGLYNVTLRTADQTRAATLAVSD